MHIGIESQRIFRAGKHGMDVVALELIRQIQRLDTSNRYTLFARKGADRSCIADTVNFHTQLVGGMMYADWEQIRLPAAVRRQRPRLLHCMGNTAPLFCPVPLVLTLHDIIYLEEVNFKGSSYQNIGNIYRRMVVPKIMDRASVIITVSAYEKMVIQGKCGTDPDKIVVVYNGVDERFHDNYPSADLDHFREAYALPRQFLLVLGNTAPKKNTEGAIRAYVRYCEHEADPLPLVIADYTEGHTHRILKKLGREELAGRILLPGYIPTEKMPLLYNCSSVFLYPSLRESFGLPVLEAMACGIPVVTSNTAAIPEIAGEAAFLTDPTDHEQVADAIGELVSNDSLRREYIGKGKQRAQHFRWEDSARKLIQVYDSFG